MYRFIFDIITDPLGLPVHDLWEYAILFLIGYVAFGVGWEVSPGGVFGSIIHWGVRLLAFFVLWAVAYILLAAAQWVIAHLALVCGSIAIATVGILIVSVTRLYFF